VSGQNTILSRNYAILDTFFEPEPAAVIKITKTHIEIDTTFCRNDLEKDQEKDKTIVSQAELIQVQKNELAAKDTIINLFKDRYDGIVGAYVVSERSLKQTKKEAKIWKYVAGGMTFLAFILGVN
jgi:hypothetical protein